MLSIAVRINNDNAKFRGGAMKKVVATVLVLLGGWVVANAQASDAGNIWNTLAAPAMDPGKYAATENVEIVRDRVHIRLVSGTIQFAKPSNGVVFAAVFRGEGQVMVDPPNPTEAQQLKLFTGQEKLAATFTEATFTFSDGLLEEVGKQVKWKDGPSGDDFYAKRQQEREDIGGEYLPRVFKSVMSPDRKRTAYFLADLKTKEAGWVQVREDAMQPEEIRVGRWVSVGPFKLADYWMIFPAGGRDPRHVYDDPAERQDFLLPSYKINAFVSEGAELGATANVTVNPRYAGERVLLFELDSNLRLSSVKDEKGNSLEFHQARERKENSQSYGDYVAVVLNAPTQTGQAQILSFVYQGKHVVNRVGDGNYFCKSFGWYPSAFASELGVDEFAFRSDFELNFRSPKKYILVATGHKAGETTDGKESVTTWKSEIPMAAAGFAFGDYKVVTDKVGDVEIQVYANNQPDDLLKSIQRHFENPLDDLVAGAGRFTRIDAGSCWKFDGLRSGQNYQRGGRKLAEGISELLRTLSLQTAGNYEYYRLLWSGMAWIALFGLVHFPGFDAAKRPGNPQPDGDDGFLPRARELAPVVGPSRGVEKLSRPVAFRRLRRILRPSLCAIPRKHEGIFNAMASGQTASD
jgi:hypothetical protein